MLLATAREIWMAVSQSYSLVWNDAQVYELVKKAHGNRQVERSLAEYYEKSELFGKKSTTMRIKLMCS